MSAENTDRLVWLDMEMTGLDPALHVPLQVAVVVSSPDLDELESLEVTISQPEEALARMTEVVERMHRESGLTEAVRRSRVSLEEADRRVAALLDRWIPKGSGVLAGSSIHQDRLFVSRYFPETRDRLHYRMVDVSSVKELVRRWYGPAALFDKESRHTALSDVRDSIAALRFYRQTVFRSRG